MAQEPKKLIDVLRHLFGETLGNDFGKETTPEEFMQGQEYSKTDEEGTDESGNVFTKTTYLSKDGKRKLTRKVMNAKPNQVQGNKDMERSNRLYTLEAELQNVIAKEEFEKAVQIRDEIAKLKNQLKNVKIK